jgi:PAS domain S-box-containing protein
MRLFPRIRSALKFNFILAVVVPFTLISFHILYTMTRRMKEEVTNDQVVLSNSLVREVEYFLEEPMHFLGQIEEILKRKVLISDGRINSYLDTIMIHYPFFDMIQILDGEGVVKYVAPYNLDYLDINLSQQPFYKETVKEGKIYWSKTFISMPTGYPTVSVTYPLKSGMIVGYLNLAELSKIVKEIRRGNTGYSIIVDGDGTIIAHPDTRFVFEQVNIKNLNIVERAAEQKKSTYRFRFLETEYIGSVAVVESTGWSVIIFQSVDEAFYSVKRARFILFSVIVIAVIAAFFISRMIIKRISNPLIQLVNNAKKIASGDYSISMQSESYFEINELARDFSRMVKAIKTREEEIKKTQTFLDSIIENIPNMVFVKEAMTLKFVRFNKAGEELLGFPRNSMIGKTDYDFFPAEEAEFFISRDREVLEKGSLLNIPEEKIETKNRGERVLHTKKIPIFDEDNVPKYLLGISEDITEYKRMEEELLNVRKLESIGMLAGGIAHDFNNILTAVLGNIELARILTERESKKQGADIIERLKEAEKAALRAKDLTQQLLTFSKGGSPVKRLASIDEILKETASFALSGSNVRCEFDIPEDLFLVEVDEGQMSQVFNNIIINADQSMPDGGVIKIGVDNIVAEQKDKAGLLESNSAMAADPPFKSGKYLKISVSDQGPGIPEEDIARIFDPYFTTKQKGNGLGLATAFSIVKRHGGHISVKTERGSGSIFAIYLPAVAGELPQKTRQESHDVHMQGRVLVMDDEETIRNVLTDILENMGYEVEVSGDGMEAVKLYSEASKLDRRFDIVIMDLTIPGGMGGKEAVKILLELDPEVKVIVSSGYSNDPVMAEFKKYGFSGVVTKPFKVADLSKILREAVS